MKTLFLFLFSVCFIAGGNAQDFRYFDADTISPRLVYLKLKGQGKFLKSEGAPWYFTKDRQLMEYLEEQVFKVAFHNVDWKQMPALTEVGVFFRFDNSLQIDYVHFVITPRSPSRRELISLEENLVEYIHLMKKVNVANYGYTDDPEKFCSFVTRGQLIRKKSSLWNEN